MRVTVFCHSLLSDWNHGNAHFLRGVCSDLLARGHAVDVYEPQDAWSATHLVAEHGQAPLQAFARAYPQLHSTRYDPASLDLDAVLADAQLVLVHEWNDHALVARIGQHHKANGHYRLLFHDTHHRGVTDPDSMAAYDLRHYDGVLAFGSAIRDLYRQKGWCRRAWTWHEAADHRVFRPLPGSPREGDLVWIGNWGDDERTAELHEFLLEPVRTLGLKARIHGVRYPQVALAALRSAGIAYGGWLPNHEAPQVFARYGVTVHVPRRPYVQALPGIPTIRVFEALACGIPLVSAPWDDCEGLFEPGADFLVARNGAEMREQLRAVLHDDALARSLAEQGRKTILARHTCAHRVDELLDICTELGVETTDFTAEAQSSRGPAEEILERPLRSSASSAPLR
jgi:spore maturation protein CgeB